MEALTRGSRRRTKIVATLGPATDDPDVVEALIRAGADVLRFNFSYGAAEEQGGRVGQVRSIASKLGRYVGIMGDLQGPKIRIESFKRGSVVLERGQAFELDTDLGSDDGDETRVGVAYVDLMHDVAPGDVLLVDDGQTVLEVEDVRGGKVGCRVRAGGLLTDRKGLNKQGGGLSAPALTDKDRTDLEAAAKLGLDFVSVSFARNAADITEARALLRSAGFVGVTVKMLRDGEVVMDFHEGRKPDL